MREIDLLDLFPPHAGEITQYYGRIGGGKTYAATADVLEKLRRGKVIYANWKINYNGTDERQSIAWVLLSLLFPWRKRFYVFPKDNLRYFEFSDAWARSQGYKDFMDWFASRTDCEIYGDEGHVMFDSYQGIKMSIEKRAAVLHTRHFDRSIHIISQRPTAIHISMRANVNRFYRCQCIWSWGSFVRFKRTEFQDMMNETVDEDEEKVISEKFYWGKNSVFDAYDTKYLRGTIEPSQRVLFKAYDFSYPQRFVLFLDDVIGSPKKRPKKLAIEPQKAPVDKLPAPVIGGMG